MDELIHRPHGILLVTGPTGSGKTTTLYAALERINDKSRNILTVEDPVEYHIDGIGQTQVNTKVDMTFARGLRAILRQDPGRRHGRRDPRPRDGRDRRPGQPDRPPRAVDAAHEHGRRRRDAAARHGRRAVPAVLEPDRRARAAARPRARPRDPRGLTRPRSTNARSWTSTRPSRHALSGADDGDAATTGAPASTRSSRRQQDAHDDPRRRRRARARAQCTQARPSIREDGIRRVLGGTTTLEEVLRVTRSD